MEMNISINKQYMEQVQEKPMNFYGEISTSKDLPGKRSRSIERFQKDKLTSSIERGQYVDAPEINSNGRAILAPIAFNRKDESICANFNYVSENDYIRPSVIRYAMPPSLVETVVDRQNDSNGSMTSTNSNDNQSTIPMPDGAELLIHYNDDTFTGSEMVDMEMERPQHEYAATRTYFYTDSLIDIFIYYANISMISGSNAEDGPNKHERVHSGGAPFVCNHSKCERSYKYRCYLARHIKWVRTFPKQLFC